MIANLTASRLTAAALLAGLGAMIVSSAALASSNFHVLYQFQGAGQGDGAQPYAGLLMDNVGNVYGTTTRGGTHDAGTVFKLAPGGAETVLFSFGGVVKGGAEPEAGVIADAEGSLYGTTRIGCGRKERGCVFKLAPNGTETILYAFQRPPDGRNPISGLIIDGQRNLYGTTGVGGGKGCFNHLGCGTVFKIAADGTESLLHSFNGPDGYSPSGALIADRSGNLYGTTGFGGAFGKGVVFKLAPDGTETTLYSFKGGNDGAEPIAELIADGAGNMYGTTMYGGGSTCGGSGCGTVFKLSSDGSETVFYAFKGGSDGASPFAGLAMDNAGNLYGTTVAGGMDGGRKCAAKAGCGTVFKLAPDGTETIVHAFDLRHGFAPYGRLIVDEKGNLYGTTAGSFGRGTVYGLVFKISD